MAISTGAKIAIGGAAALAAYFLFAGTSNAAPVDPHVAGHNAGCADGTADAKAGHPPIGAADVTGSATISAAAKASGDAVAYLDGYMTGYNECYSANAPAKVTPTSPKPKPVTKPKPGAPPGADKPGAMDAYGKGCFQGAKDGYYDGLGGSSNHPHPADYASGNAAAFAAGYRRSYSDAYSKGNFGYQAAVDAGFPPADAAAAATDAADTTYPDTVAAGCDGYFDGWWASTTGTGGVVGTGARFVASTSRASASPNASACYSGARDGWMAGAKGDLPISFDVDDAYAASYIMAYNYASKMASPKPMHIPTDILNKINSAVCGTVSARAAGIEGFFQRIEVGGIALVGARRPRMVVQRLMPAIAVPKEHPLGWPAPPPGSSRIYRSY